MGGLGYAFAGALQGLGAGLAETGRSAEAERRAIALENLRSSNNRAEQNNTADNQDRNNARQTARETDSRITIAKEEGGIAEKRDAANFGRDVKKIGINASVDNAQAILGAALQRQNDAASKRLQNDLDKGDVAEVLAGANGNYIMRYKDGRMVDSGVGAAPKELVSGSGSSGGTVLDAARGGGVGQASAPARTAAPQRPSGKTMTQADIAATAKAKGMTAREAKRILEELGYRLTD